MATGVNTGNEIFTQLLRVRQDISDPEDPFYREPLDVNDVPIRISGLPQASKPNLATDPDFVASEPNLTKCPVSWS